jgi:hypothetical protein
METYVTPEMLIIPLERVDILTTSGDIAPSFEDEINDILNISNGDDSTGADQENFLEYFGLPQK